MRALVAKSPTSAFSLVAAVNRHGRSALHVACVAGRVEATKVLLQVRTTRAGPGGPGGPKISSENGINIFG